MIEQIEPSRQGLREPVGAFSLVYAIATTICVALVWYGELSPEVAALSLLAGAGIAALVAWQRAQFELKRDFGDVKAWAKRLNEHMLVLKRQVSDLRGTENSLRRTQAQLATAQRLAKIGNWRWSVESDEMTECSLEGARILGMGLENVHGLTFDQLMRTVHPDERASLEAAFDEIGRSADPYQIEYRIIRADGEVRHVMEIGEAVCDESGHAIEYIGTTQDVTELKETEEALKRAHDELERRVAERSAELETLNETLRFEMGERKRAEKAWRERELTLRSVTRIARLGYAIWNERAGIGDTYVVLSDEFAQLFGLTAEEYLARFPTRELDYSMILPADRERYEASDAAYIASPAPMEIEYRVAVSGDRVQYLREFWTPVFDEAGELLQTICALQDVTDLKRAQEQLRRAQKMEAVGQLTGGIAHDFNNLLAVILGNLELVLGEVGEAGEVSECAQRAIAAAERGGKLTHRLLAFSRKQALRPEPVDANALVRRMLELLRRTLGETVEIEVGGDAELWLSLVDPGQLENALLNLAINARDAM
ncbi:MAG: PAS domain-containing protein, partial [Myxococcales bacterium]|nr:PAS domain-containing protein [Myxococcales bacterium]